MNTVDQVQSHRLVEATLDNSEVAVVVAAHVGRHFGVDPVLLDVTFNEYDGAYVKGEISLDRDQVLSTLRVGHTTEELMSLRATALATLDREPGDHAATALLHIVDALDGTSQGLSLSDALKQSGNVLKSEDVTVVRGVYKHPLTDLKHEVASDVVEALRVERAGLVAENEAASGWGAAVGARGERIAEIDRTLKRVVDEVGPAVGSNPGTQVGTGRYTPGSEELPEVQVDRAEDPATITVDSICLSLSEVLLKLEQAGKTSDVGLALFCVGEARTVVLSLQSVLQKYRSCALVEGGASFAQNEPVVPRRGPTTDSLETAKEKLRSVYENLTSLGGKAPRATEVAYIYSLLGGEEQL